LNDTNPCRDKGRGFTLPDLPEPENMTLDQKEEIKRKEKKAEEEPDYPKLDLIFCRKGKLKDSNEEQIVLIESGDCEEAFITLRLENLCAGEYYVLYRVDFRPIHKYRKLNLVFYSEFMQKLSQAELDAENAIRLSEGSLSLAGRRSINKFRPRTAHSQKRPGSAISMISKKRRAKKSSNNMQDNDEYNPKMAIEFELIDSSSFKNSFFDKMEQIAYSRWVDGLNNEYVHPTFADSTQLNFR